MTPRTVNGRRLTRSRVLALLLVPILVAGSAMLAAWGVNDNLRDVQAAVVNQDEMVTIDGQPVPLGRQLAAALTDSDADQNFTWVLTDAANADRGLTSGRYAAVVTIPKNFSTAATSTAGTADEARQATISVQTSPVIGVAESTVGQSVADAAVRSLNRQLTGVYLNNVYLGFSTMREQLVGVSDGARQLADGTRTLSDGLTTAVAGSHELDSGLATLADNSVALTDGGAQVHAGADQLSSGLGQLAEGAHALPAQTRALADGSAQVAAGAAEASAGAGQLRDGADALASGAGRLADGARGLETGVATYTAGVEEYARSGAQVARLARELTGVLGTMLGLVDPLDHLLSTLPDRAAGLDRATGAADRQLRAGLATADAVGTEGDALAAHAEDARRAVAALAEGTGAPSCPPELADTPGACAAFEQGVRAGAAQTLTHLDAVDPTDLRRTTSQLAASREELTGSLDVIRGGVAAFAAGAGEMADQWATVKKDLPAAQAPDDTVLANLQAFEQGGTQLIAGAGPLNEGAGSVAAGAAQVSTGATEVALGTGTLADGLTTLTGGSTQLAVGNAALADGTPTLVAGIGQAHDAATQLSTGTGTFVAGVGQYTAGVDTAAVGMHQLADGLDQAATGAMALADGASALATGVAEGARTIPSYTEIERYNLAQVASAPIATTGPTPQVAPATALATLLLVVALWLGALASFVLIPPIDPRSVHSSAATSALYARAVAPAAKIALAQAVLLTALGSAWLQLGAGTTLGLGLLLVASGLAFVAVNHALAAWSPLWGRLAAGVLLLLTLVPALTGAAPVLDALRGLSPASTSLDALRELLTGRDLNATLLALVGWTIAGMLLGAVQVARSRVLPPAALARAHREPAGA